MGTGRPESKAARITTGAVVALVAALVASGCGNDNGVDGERNGDPSSEHNTSGAPNGEPSAAPEGQPSVEPGGEHSAEPGPAPANLAFIDVEATQAVLDQMTPAVDQFFNYDFREFDEHVAQIQTTFTPDFTAEMEPGLQVVREVALTKEVTSEAEVLATSVRSLHGGTAELLLFVKRTTTEEGKEPQTDISSVMLTAAQVGPDWKIDGMRVR